MSWLIPIGDEHGTLRGGLLGTAGVLIEFAARSMFLLDSNEISALRKARAGKADPHVAAWVQAVPSASLFLSVIAIQELEIGALLAERRDLSNGAILRAWLNDHVLPSFSERTSPRGWASSIRNPSDLAQ